MQMASGRRLVWEEWGGGRGGGGGGGGGTLSVQEVLVQFVI